MNVCVVIYACVCTCMCVCTHMYMIFFILVSLHNSDSKTFKDTTGLSVNEEVTVHTYEKPHPLSVKYLR